MLCCCDTFSFDTISQTFKHYWSKDVVNVLIFSNKSGSWQKKIIDFYCIYLHALGDMNNKFTIALITIDYWVHIPQFTNKCVFPTDMIVESNSAFPLNLAHNLFQKRYRIHIHGTFSHFKSPKTGDSGFITFRDSWNYGVERIYLSYFVQLLFSVEIQVQEYVCHLLDCSQLPATWITGSTNWLFLLWECLFIVSITKECWKEAR